MTTVAHAYSQLTGQLVQATLQQPKPTPSKRPYASFLEDFVDPVDTGRCPASVHTFVSEWLESAGEDRERRSRSDSHLHHSDGGPIPRQLTKSAPEPNDARGAAGFAMPPTPVCTGSRSYRDSHAGSVVPSGLTGASRASGRTSASRLIEGPTYRRSNLAVNNIYLQDSLEQAPEHITDLINHVRNDRGSPGPSPDEVRQDGELRRLRRGAMESEIETYLKDKMFPKPRADDILDRADNLPMLKHTVPSTGARLKVSNPVPDILYGYNYEGAFPQQQAEISSMELDPTANSQGSLYPFLVIEIKGDGPNSVGSIWAATNQCLGGSAACINIAEDLNRRLTNCESDEVRPFRSAVFSIAMRGTEARLYISWKHNELAYHTANVGDFLLQDPQHHLEFRKYVLNIFDWGRDERHKEIQNSLDSLQEYSRLGNSEAAKARSPPSDGPGAGRNKRHKGGSP